MNKIYLIGVPKIYRFSYLEIFSFERVDSSKVFFLNLTFLVRAWDLWKRTEASLFSGATSEFLWKFE